jgi:hypothetical protein
MHQLYTGHLIEAAQSENIAGSDHLIRIITQAQSDLADLVAKHHGIAHSATLYDMGELASGFGPAKQGQDCPEALVQFDESSDWIEEPENEQPIIPFVVLFRLTDGTFADSPRSFVCRARDRDHAENLCRAFVGFPIEVLWVTETDRIEDAIASYWLADEPGMLRGVPFTPAVNDRRQYPFVLTDHSIKGETVDGTITALPYGLAVQVTGYTDNGSQDDRGGLFVLTRVEGALRLLVFADVNQADPTHDISLEDARNMNRKEEPTKPDNVEVIRRDLEHGMVLTVIDGSPVGFYALHGVENPGPDDYEWDNGFDHEFLTPMEASALVEAGYQEIVDEFEARGAVFEG